MKREYTKPDILFESFSLSTSIAGNCAIKTFLPGVGTCGMQYGASVLFTTGVISQCNSNIASDVICYHNPTDSNNLFRS